MNMNEMVMFEILINDLNKLDIASWSPIWQLWQKSDYVFRC